MTITSLSQENACALPDPSLVLARGWDLGTRLPQSTPGLYHTNFHLQIIARGSFLGGKNKLQVYTVTNKVATIQGGHTCMPHKKRQIHPSPLAWRKPECHICSIIHGATFWTDAVVGLWTMQYGNNIKEHTPSTPVQEQYELLSVTDPVMVLALHW